MKKSYRFSQYIKKRESDFLKTKVEVDDLITIRHANDYFNDFIKLTQLKKIDMELPKGFKVYKCTDCQSINVKKDNEEIRVGFCDECEHPLWNDVKPTKTIK